MGMINHTVGLTIGAGGMLCSAFAAHAAWPDTFGFLSGAGSAYPLQGVDALSGITSTLATIDPFLLGGIAMGAMFIAKSVMKSDHPAPSHG